jgi:anti-sigma regulatory factor (Ser/Thr protein kinase)
VAEAATRAGLERATIDLAAVAASELVTNAVVHGRGPISVRTVLDPASLRVEVQDTAAELPHRVDPDQAHEGGRGLTIVDAVSEEWGCTVVRGASGKSVWFTVERQEADDRSR